MSTVRIIAFLVAAVLIGVALKAVYNAGRAAGDLDCIEQQAERDRQALDQAQKVDEQQQGTRLISAEAETGQQAIARAQTREVIRYVQTHPDPPACELDADGLRLWAAANAGTDPTAAPAGPGDDGGVPAAAAAGERRAVGPAGEPRRDGAALPRLQAAASQPDGMVAGAVPVSALP